MTIDEFKTVVTEAVRAARASGIPPLTITLALSLISDQASMPVPPNADPILEVPPVNPPAAA